MPAGKADQLWLLATGILIVIIITGTVIIWTHRDGGQPVSLVPSQDTDVPAEVNIQGAVARPGIYPLKSSDSIDSLIGASGGSTEQADLSRLTLYIAESGSPDSEQATLGPQKINVNRAEAWLLEALPAIGPGRAQDIVKYREQHGPFPNIEAVTNVPGISAAVFEEIKSLITVVD